MPKGYINVQLIMVVCPYHSAIPHAIEAKWLREKTLFWKYYLMTIPRVGLKFFMWTVLYGSASPWYINACKPVSNKDLHAYVYQNIFRDCYTYLIIRLFCPEEGGNFLRV